MLLKFLNLGSGFPVENRLKPFFPFIARQPENTRHQGSVQPALLATQLISFNLLLTARRIGNILCPTPTINFALLGRIYLSKYLLFIASRLWETENECPGDRGLSKRIAFPVPACVWLWRVGSLVFVRCTMDGSPLSRLRCGLSLAASDIARRHRGWRSPGSQVSLDMAVSHLPVCNCWWLHHSWRGGSSPWSSDHHTSPRSVLRRIDDNGRTSQCPVVCGLTLIHNSSRIRAGEGEICCSAADTGPILR